jgi:hypothetical protein
LRLQERIQNLCTNGASPKISRKDQAPSGWSVISLRENHGLIAIGLA